MFIYAQRQEVGCFYLSLAQWLNFLGISLPSTSLNRKKRNDDDDDINQQQ